MDNPGSSLMFKPDPTAKVVFIMIHKDLSCGVLQEYPYPTPRFDIHRLPSGKYTQWRVQLEFDPDLGFNDAITARTDVLNYMLSAPRYIDTTNIMTVRKSVSKLLMHWAEMFPQGVTEMEPI